LLATADRRSRRTGAATQRGAVTLIVVMVLLFVVALVAAYTARNLVFDQRMSANHLRAAQAFEAAEAGLDWALAMLNSGRIDASCTPRTDPAATDGTFRARYLSIAADTGVVTVRHGSGGQPLRPACVFDGSGWNCSCPTDGAPALDAPVAAGPHPAFVVRFFREPHYPPGVVRIESTGCTRFEATEVCRSVAEVGDGVARTTVLAALRGALVSAPVAAITARGNLGLGSNMLVAVNRDVGAGGHTLHLGGMRTGAWRALHGPPGTPEAQTIIDEPDDGPMAALDAGRMFASVFGMYGDTYRLQPATITLDCSVDCSAATVRDVVRLNPGRMLWVAGNLLLDVDDPIGSASDPVLLVVTGSLSVAAGSQARIYGLVYVIGGALANDHAPDTPALTLNGALVGEGNLAFSGAGTTTIAYDGELLARLRTTHGSFVRVPGSWRDF
jgi:hypothetical protein